MAQQLTPALLSMLGRIRRGYDRGKPVLAIQLVGDKQKLDCLIAVGFAALIDEPGVVDRRTGEPATAVRTTDAGRAALGQP